MRKSFAITAGFALGFIALAIVTLPNFVSYRARGPVKAVYDAAPAVQYAPAPGRSDTENITCRTQAGIRPHRSRCRPGGSGRHRHRPVRA